MSNLTALTQKKDFVLLFRRGKKIESPLFRLIVSQNKFLYSRVAVVIPKSVDKRAVGRNMIRRRIKEWARKNIFFRSTHVDIVFLVKKDASSAPKSLLYEELEKNIKKI